MGRTTRNASRPARLAGLTAAALLSATGLAACGDTAGPEQGDVAVEDLQELENQLSTLDDRVTELEYDASTEGASPGDAVGAVEIGEELWVEPSTVLGEDVTVSADVSEVVTANGAAFRIAGDSGDPVAVIATHPPDGMEVGDTVRVTGAVKQIQRTSFEEDFGWAADELFDGPDDFFGEAEGEVAVAATEVELLDDDAAE